MIYLGVDPDLNNTALALIDEAGAVGVHVISIGTNHKGLDAVECMCAQIGSRLPLWADTIPEPNKIRIESQKVYVHSKSDPDDLIRLATVSGALVLACQQLWSKAGVRLVLPQDWKGQQPKGINQGRTFAALGIPFECTGKPSDKKSYCYPTTAPATIKGAGALKKADWKHVGDALGLALYARKLSSPSGR